MRVLFFIISILAVACDSLSIMIDSTPLKISCWNSRGLRTAVPYLRSLLERNDIVGVCEHWLHENRLMVLDDMADTHCVHARASNACVAAEYGRGRGQGGTAIFWKKDIKSVSVVSNVLLDRACGIRVQNAVGGICYFWCVYMPALGSVDDLGSALDELAEVVERRDPGSNLCIMGDFNGDVGTSYGVRGARPPTARGLLVCDFIRRNGLTPMNMAGLALGPVDTFQGPFSSSTLDYILVSASLEHLVTECHVAGWDALNLSDHTSVHAFLKFGDIPRHQRADVAASRVRWDKMNADERYRKYEAVIAPELDGLAARLASEDITNSQVDEVIDRVIECITDVSTRLPKSRFSKHLKPFWNEELSLLKRTKVSDHRAWVKQGRPRAENPFFVAYKTSKKEFSRRLRRLSIEYDNAEIVKVSKMAEVSRNNFWRLVKRARGSIGVDSVSIRNTDGKVVYESDDVLNVWKSHFERVGTPKIDPEFDHRHYVHVTQQVKLYNSGVDVDDFSRHAFSEDEIVSALKQLNKGKACGIDGISAEHLCYGGRSMVSLLCLLFNRVRVSEYIPKAFRVGVQVPLHKGKGACPLDPDSYRGITLLSTFNKLFEVLMWRRLEGWWCQSGVVSGLQFACKKGVSCLNTAFLLKETIATSMEEHDLVYAAFFDVAKAFDSVWIDGLFYQLWEVGIRGKTWRVFYRCYLDFWCVARVQGHVSGWYQLKFGIHQGGYMSLIKYTAFINSLIILLKESGRCCSIGRIPSSPAGYADDLAACCTSEHKMDCVLRIVYRHGCTWRYNYNAKKSGIMVFGETPRTNKHNAEMRHFRLGGDRVKERLSYDHVGVTACLYDDDASGIVGRISKARRAFNAISGLGIRRNGLSMYTCCMIFWSIIVPIALFGCEMWVLNDSAVRAIEDFQVYAGKRIQRLFSRSPNIWAFYGLGWIRLERLVEIRKLLFVRSLMALNPEPLKVNFL